MNKLINKLLGYLGLYQHDWDHRLAFFTKCKKCGHLMHQFHADGVGPNKDIGVFCEVSDKEYNIRNILE
jgi:hypothetical protein